MAEEQEFQVIDKRRVKAEGSGAEASTTAGQDPAESSTTAAGGGGTAAGEDAASGGVTADEVWAAAEAAAAQEGEGGAEVPPLDLPTALNFCINMLNEVAWMKMGLIPNPLTGKIERDLSQAKAAIDSVNDLVPRLEPFIAEAHRRELQVLLSNLRINFVQQTQKV